MATSTSTFATLSGGVFRLPVPMGWGDGTLEPSAGYDPRMVARSYCQNLSEIASERFDDGLVIINFLTGRYFAMNRLGEALWDVCAAPTTRESMTGVLTCLDGAPDAGGIATDLEAFLNTLLENRLLVAAEGAGVGECTLAGPYEAPSVEVYDELSDLILLDPIHDVNEAVGWPAPLEPASKQ